MRFALTMSKLFITYGTDDYAYQVNRICLEARSINRFEEVKAFSPKDVSPDVKESELFIARRGGGYWLWKPDIIFATMNNHKNGDVVIYCDAGCSIYNVKQWEWYFSVLSKYDILAQKIYQPTYKWTTKETIDCFAKTNGQNWQYSYQFCTGVIAITITPFTRRFIQEWRDIMLNHPEFVKDVVEKELLNQCDGFIENRHDQSVYSALVYRYLNSDQRSKIYPVWERIEDKDIIRKQAIRATRLRNKDVLSQRHEGHLFPFFDSIRKDWLYEPFVLPLRELRFNYMKKKK